MKSPWRLLVVALASLSCAVLPVLAAPPMRILPMGDSITEGTTPGGYRGTLYTVLTAAGYNVDFVGTNTVNPGTLTEKEHEGHGGWRIDQLDSNVATWFSAIEDPDFILLHIGTNDFGQNNATATAIDRLDALILKMATLRPNANIIVTNLMQRDEPFNSAIVAQFNPFVQARVNAHAAAGRKVTFLDMRSVVPITDMPDNLHPNQVGYDKMANAWKGAIQTLSTPDGDFAAPKIARIRGNVSRTEVSVTFSKPVADTAANPANFSLSGGLSVSAATLDASKRVVTLTTSLQIPATSYTITVNNVVDRISPTPHPIAVNSSGVFVPALPRGYRNYAPESSAYTLAYSLDIPTAPFYRSLPAVYQIDNRGGVGGFDRVAYYLELQGADGQLNYVWASMDAFTQDVNKIAVPTVASGAVFQQGVSNLNVISNVPGVSTGAGLTGNIEFWPTNYEKANTTGVPGASGTVFDFGDQRTAGDYGCMQIHNTGAAQTVFAFNNWGSNVPKIAADLGIGTDPAPVNDGLDWTFHNNAAGYTVKTLQVLVRTTGDVTPPTLLSAMASPSRTQVVVGFSEPVSAASVDALNFGLDHGVNILTATLSENHREVTLVTDVQPPATPLTLTVSNVRDSSANANRIAPASTIAVAAAALPAEVTANIGAAANGYQLVYSADLPVGGNLVAANPYRFDDHLDPGLFSRVAYYLELQQDGAPTRYVWASMDSFASGRRQIGIPTFASGAVFQQNVTNLQVVSNMPGVVNGTTASGGNIEFWPHSYTQANGALVPNANGGTYDTGDTRSTANSGDNQFGSMQIHNHDPAANQTVFALNHFAADGNPLDVGIGNQSGGSPDWTFAANAGNYTRRILHVMVLPGQTTSPALIAKVPEAANYQLAYSLDIPTTGNLYGGTGFTPYTVNQGGAIDRFSRVAYYMELQKTGDSVPNYVWVSMDAFTTNGALTGVPTGVIFQQKVNNMNVVSNVAGIVNGSNLSTGNIEFWPGDYNGSNGIAIPGASGDNFDWGDGGPSGGSGYGSMQVHNHGASQTLFAMNRWGTLNSTSNILCLGIGNNPSPVNKGVDWTFAENAPTWNVKRLLQVYVLPGNADTTPPALQRASASTHADRLTLNFDEPIAESAAASALITIPGLAVTGVERNGPKSLAVHTAPQVPGTLYTVNISGVRDRSPAANTTPLSGTFTAYSVPAVFANVAEISGYQHVLSLDLPSAAPRYNTFGVAYGLDDTKYGDIAFDRVAYLMELDGNWAYASFDKHTSQLSQIGVPVVGTNPVPIQQVVQHMNVASNAAGVVNATDIATGNIEFWAGNYDPGNGIGIPGANGGTYDFGDVMTSGTYGCMQIHNYGAAQTIMAFNDWGNNTDPTDTGIGNRPTGAPDWTFAMNAPGFTKRNLHVLVRPGGAPTGMAPLLYSDPSAKTAATGGLVTFSVSVAGSGPFTYQWRHNGVNIAGATRAWLDLTNLGAGDVGSYDVIVTGPGTASTTSATASLTITGLPLPPTGIVVHPDKTVSLEFHGITGTSYLLQRSTTLLPGAWETLDTVTAPANGEMDYLDDEAPAMKAFYRATPVP